MKVNRSTLSKQLAEKLDAMDKDGKDGKIEASIWNKFVKDKGGLDIKNYIKINVAIKSLILYLCRQAKEKSKLIVDLGQEWINSLDENNLNKINNTKTNTTEKSGNNIVNLQKKVDISYSKMTRTQALKRAKNDSRLEKLSGGNGWSIAEKCFITDIPYARKHTGEILSFVSSLIGENIVVTSALGTAGTNKTRTPHKISQSYCTHHNAENPKLDIKTNGNSYGLRKKLIATGLFSRVSVEPDHLDIQIKNEVYLAFEKGADTSNILACARKNNFNSLFS